MMQSQDRYSFTWQTYSDHLRETLKEMMTSTDFTDVTLVTDDKQHIMAHRNILSACSPVFKNILKLGSGNTHPVIYLRGIQYSELESIMQYIYLGEARLHEERMGEFLVVSKNLEIKELAIGIEELSVSNEESNGTHEEAVAEDPAPTMFEDNSIFKHQTHIKTKTFKPLIESHVANKKVIKTEGGKYACNQCDYRATQKGNMTQHIQSVHAGVKYPCNRCNYQATQQSNLTTHIQSVHEGVKYACSHCDHQASKQSNLTMHVKRKHM